MIFENKLNYPIFVNVKFFQYEKIYIKNIPLLKCKKWFLVCIKEWNYVFLKKINVDLMVKKT